MFKKATTKMMFYLALATLILTVLIPLMYFITLSFASNYESYRFPSKFLPTVSYNAKIVYTDNKYSIQLLEDDAYVSVIRESNVRKIRTYLLNQLNVKLDTEELEQYLAQAKEMGELPITLKKSMLRNYAIFFLLAEGSVNAFFNSLQAAGYTILISILIGGTSGYALARYQFKFKKTLNMSLLMVRMFPIVAISLPMVIYVIKMNLFDTPFSLALVYSIPNIALTAWITNSIFQGISVELEEASLVFGATRLQTFAKITLPLALPALVASSLYAFLAAWNDSISALIMTNENPTLALVVYRTVGSSNIPNIPAAGAIILFIPSLVFTFIIKNYINNLWGNVKV